MPPALPKPTGEGETTAETFIQALFRMKEEGGSYAAIQGVAAEYATKEPYLSQAASAELNLPGLNMLAEDLDTAIYRKTAFKEVVGKKEFKDLLDLATNTEKYPELQAMLWNNFLISIFTESNVSIISAHCKALSLLHLINLLAEEGATVARIPMVLLPEWVYDLILTKPSHEDKSITKVRSKKEGEPITPLNKAIRIGSNIIESKDFCLDMSEDYNPCGTKEPQTYTVGKNYAARIFWADLLVTKQSLVKYELGEVAHIESVMKSEIKVRTHRRLDRMETNITTDYETTKESERETQTTERFSIEKESTNVINQQMQIESGVNVSATYGVTKVEASLGFAYGVSSSQSNTEATSFSKDVTSRALTRVKERTRTLKTVTVIHEIEDTNEHTFNNTDPNGDHINGVYRWLDKIYLNKIFNYGGRMMMELTIAEPASFYIFRKLVSANAQNSIPKPIHPSELGSVGADYINITSFEDIKEDNYALLAAYFGVQGLESPPDEYIVVNTAFKDLGDTATANHGHFVFKEDIVIPENYEAEKAEFYFNAQGYGGNAALSGWIGNKSIEMTAGNFGYGSPSYGGPIDLKYLDNSLVEEYPIESLSIALKGMAQRFVITVYVLCRRREKFFNAWQVRVFDKIMEAYNLQLSEYNNWLRQQSYNLEIEGNNPYINRQIEREELKKRAIELISGQRFESFDAAVNGIQNTSGYPEILFNESRKEGMIVKYFEQVFEWENMTYIFYPYFYGRKNNWLTVNTLRDDDPIFEKFLKAGYARVIVPVRPGFEKYASLNCGLASWIADLDPQYIPGVDAPWYISIAAELQAAANIIEDDEDSVIGHYLQRVPTNLVYLAPLALQPGDSAPGLPDNSADGLIAGWL